jgi:hypothetical protein
MDTPIRSCSKVTRERATIVIAEFKRYYAFRLWFIRDGFYDTLVCNAWVRKNGDYKDCSLDV